MKSLEDKSCSSYGASQDSISSNSSFEFHKGNGATKASQHRSKALGARPKTTPSKWDDAQKWLVGLSGGGGGERGSSKNKPRNSNADDRRLLGSASQRERHSCSSAEGLSVEDIGVALALQDEGDTKKIDCGEGIWRIDKPTEDSTLAVRSVCVRDMGTEMTPITSQEPSRTATPLRAGTPVSRSPIQSRSSTPIRCHQGSQVVQDQQGSVVDLERMTQQVLLATVNRVGERPKSVDDEVCGGKNVESSAPSCEGHRDLSSLDSRAMAWDEAEKAKYTARYKREEVRIQAWENHEKRKAETEMRKMEVKAERMKARAQERLTNKLAATRRMAEEKRANAEAKLKEKASRTSERADFIRRTGHLPSHFSFKLPSLCRRKICKMWSRKLRIC